MEQINFEAHSLIASRLLFYFCISLRSALAFYHITPNEFVFHSIDYLGIHFDLLIFGSISRNLNFSSLAKI